MASELSNGEPEFSWPPKRVVIFGCGLLGGSIARRCQKTFPETVRVAVGRRPQVLEELKSSGLIQQTATDHKDLIEPGDWIILCQPVEIISKMLPEFCTALPENVLVTDVGSTKARIVAAGESTRSGRQCFVGSHPMAGSEKTGWQHSREDLFEGATTIVTATEKTPTHLVSLVSNFWQALGSRIVWMEPDRHDQLIALISHTPHLTASALIDVILDSGDDAPLLSLVSGNGLRDTTRVAMGSADLWTQISLENADAISLQLEEMAEKFQNLALMLRDRDREGLIKLLQRASELRGELAKPACED